MESGLQPQWVVTAGFRLSHSTAMRPDRSSAGRQCVKISSRRHSRDIKSVDYVTDGDLSFLFDQFQDLAAPLLGQQSCVVVPLSHVCRSRARVSTNETKTAEDSC